MLCISCYYVGTPEHIYKDKKKKKNQFADQG